MDHNIIKVKGFEYRAGEASKNNDCKGCAFEEDAMDKRCDAAVCTPLSRLDGEHVIYKLIVKGETK